MIDLALSIIIPGTFMTAAVIDAVMLIGFLHSTFNH